MKHQGKFLSMLGEIGTTLRPKTRPKNKLGLNMKKLLNPKLDKKKITVIEDSSSQEELEYIEDKNVEIEQQTNIEENEISKAEVKEVEPVENIFHAELNQGVKEDVK